VIKKLFKSVEDSGVGLDGPVSLVVRLTVSEDGIGTELLLATQTDPPIVARQYIAHPVRQYSQRAAERIYVARPSRQYVFKPGPKP